MAYPSVYPLSRPIVATHSLPAGSPSRSIHVGAPSVNIDVQTARHRIAHHNLEKQVSTLFFLHTRVLKSTKSRSLYDRYLAGLTSSH